MYSFGTFFGHIFLPLLVLPDFRDRYSFGHLLGKRHILKASKCSASKLEGFADFAEIPEFVNKLPVGYCSLNI